MFKTSLFLLLFAFSFPRGFSQCLTPLPPPACTGTESLLTDNETITSGITKWYYGASTTMNSLTLDGGTLVVCGDLTIDKFYMNSGSIYVRPGARFVISSGIGAGIILRGDAYIFNYGVLEIQRNLSFDPGATIDKPSVLINASTTSILKMSNQYFVINDPYSYFVNHGKAEFWGIITDPNTSAGALCFGDGSFTRMAVLINKVADSYSVPNGRSCLNVFSFSQFSNQLTSDPNLFVCLPATHTSVSGCGGCPANNWGSAQVFTDCAGCDALAVLGTTVSSFEVSAKKGFHELRWMISNPAPGGICRVYRLNTQTNFQLIDSIPVRDAQTGFYTSTDFQPQPGNNYYMINYSDPRGTTVNSKTIRIFTETADGFTVYPIPFKNDFTIKYSNPIRQVILTDVTGRNVPINYSFNALAGTVEVSVNGSILPGIYIVHIRTDKNVMAKTIFKE